MCCFVCVFYWYICIYILFNTIFIFLCVCNMFIFTCLRRFCFGRTHPQGAHPPQRGGWCCRGDVTREGETQRIPCDDGYFLRKGDDYNMIYVYMPVLYIYIQWYEPRQGLLLMDARVADHITTSPVVSFHIPTSSHHIFACLPWFCRWFVTSNFENPKHTRMDCWTAWMPMDVCNGILNLCWGLLNPISTERSWFFLWVWLWTSTGFRECKKKNI